MTASFTNKPSMSQILVILLYRIKFCNYKKPYCNGITAFL